MEVMELKGSSLRAAPRAPVPLWHELPAELLLRILTVDGIGGAELSRTGATGGGEKSRCNGSHVYDVARQLASSTAPLLCLGLIGRAPDALARALRCPRAT